MESKQSMWCSMGLELGLKRFNKRRNCWCFGCTSAKKYCLLFCL